jgi:hypothetical protein
VRTTFFRIMKIASNYDAEKWFSRGIPRARPFFPPGYSQNPIFNKLLNLVLMLVLSIALTQTA